MAEQEVKLMKGNEALAHAAIRCVVMVISAILLLHRPKLSKHSQNLSLGRPQAW